MIKSLKIAAVIGLIATGASAQTWWVKAQNGLNVRDSSYSYVIGKVGWSQKLAVQSCSSGWCEISWNGNGGSGWVSSKYLSQSNSHCAQQKTYAPKKKKKVTY